MRTAILERIETSDYGTFGIFTLDDGTSWHSGELPWNDNEHGTSCIPAGTYRCTWINSPKHGECYQVLDVPGRSMIEIHSANFMGATSKGYACQLLGCIALGKSVGHLEGREQTALLQSRVAISEFENNMNQADFELTITDQF